MNIKKILAGIVNYIKSLFGKLPDELKNAIHIGVTVTENVKQLVDSPVLDILTAIIPGDIDDRIKLWLRESIPVILTKLKMAQDGLNDQAALAEGITTLNNLDGEVKSALLHNFSILVAQAASNQELKWKDGVYLLEWYYNNNVKA